MKLGRRRITPSSQRGNNAAPLKQRKQRNRQWDWNLPHAKKKNAEKIPKKGGIGRKKGDPIASGGPAGGAVRREKESAIGEIEKKRRLRGKIKGKQKLCP